MTSLSLARYGRDVKSVFDLLGTSENDLTAALAYGISHSPDVLARLVGISVDVARDAVLRLESAEDEGRTDLEVDVPDGLTILEAKRGWRLPTTDQLQKYAERINRRGAGRLFTLSDCTQEWAADPRHLPPSVEGVPVEHLPWSLVRRHIRARARLVRGSEQAWLRQLDNYLGRAIRVRDAADSWVYCVVISSTKPGAGGASTFFDFIDKQDVYFHPWGAASRWPKTPPNFLAFRWDGKVQRVHRVVDHTVVHTLQDRWPDIPVTPETAKPHVIYTLGARLKVDPIPVGKKIYPSARMWVLLDQLLTHGSLVDAKAASDAIASGGAGD